MDIQFDHDFLKDINIYNSQVKLLYLLKENNIYIGKCDPAMIKYLTVFEQYIRDSQRYSDYMNHVKQLYPNIYKTIMDDKIIKHGGIDGNNNNTSDTVHEMLYTLPVQQDYIPPTKRIKQQQE